MLHSALKHFRVFYVEKKDTSKMNTGKCTMTEFV